MTDEGQRQLKVLDFSVEWYNLEHIPLIQLHFLTNRSPPLISHANWFRSANSRDSFPPGEAKNGNRKLLPFNGQLSCAELRADAIRPYNCGGRAADGSTDSRPLQGCAAFGRVLLKIRGLHYFFARFSTISQMRSVLSGSTMERRFLPISARRWGSASSSFTVA